MTRNLWHSCGKYTLDELFSRSQPGVLELAKQFVAMLRSLGDVQVIAQKTRLVCVARVRFSGLYPRKNGFDVAFSLHRWLASPRIVRTIDYGPAWRSHYVRITSAADLDRELKAWLKESYRDVGLQRGVE